MVIKFMSASYFSQECFVCILSAYPTSSIVAVKRESGVSSQMFSSSAKMDSVLPALPSPTRLPGTVPGTQ